MTRKRSVHDGHRERVRQRYFEHCSLDGWASHEALEMLLFFSRVQGNTNNIAHSLIEEFGSLKGVFDANVNQLKSVDGIGEHSAALIKLVPELMKRYQEETIQNTDRITNITDAVTILRPKFIGQAIESMFLICLNNDGKILNTSFINSGGGNFTQVDMRNIVNEMAANNCNSSIIAHNHPGGLCVPSADDIAVTSQITEMLSSINAKLIDHLIITQDEYFSMASSPATKHCFNLQSKSDVDIYEINVKKEGCVK